MVAPRRCSTQSVPRRSASSLPFSQRGRVPLTQGFVGATAEGRPTVLGRGGSDFTASLLGAALDALRVEIWTDVNGLMTADPTDRSGSAHPASATYDEAAELATFGAKVLHPATQLPLAAAGIPIVILNAQHPDNPGTIIGLTRASALRADGPIGSISWKPGAILINVGPPECSAHTDSCVSCSRYSSATKCRWTCSPAVK